MYLEQHILFKALSTEVHVLVYICFFLLEIVL